jgi:pilus assembly protein CpaF
MGGFALPSRTIREMIVSSVDIIIQAARLRDSPRRIFEGDGVTMQDLMVYEITGEDTSGRLKGRHRSTGIGRPRFWERARYYGEDARLARALDASELNENIK